MPQSPEGFDRQFGINQPVRCAYCGQDIPPEDLEQKSIISRNWAPSLRSPLRNYHKSKSCAGYDQMAHEG